MLKDELKVRSVRNELNGSFRWTFRSNPLPWGVGGKKKKRNESRDIDLALFMLNAIGLGTRCFTLCLHRAAMRLRKRKHNQEGSLFVVCSLCESESATACVGFGWGEGGGGDSQSKVLVI